MNNLNIGDKVILKTGGYIMTITGFTYDDEYAQCDWQDSNGVPHSIPYKKDRLYKVI